jgi:hypothetical protein
MLRSGALALSSAFFVGGAFVGGAVLVGAGPASATSLRASALAASNPRRTVYLLDCRGDRLKIKPKSVILACADDGILVEKASWTHWGRATATASAALAENDCTPNCAGGTFHSEPAHVTVTRVHKRNGVYVYGSISVVPKAPNRLGFHSVRATIPG